MPFTKVPAELVPSGQLVLDGDVQTLAFSRVTRFKGASAAVLSALPPLTLVGNLLSVVAPARPWDMPTFAGLGLSIASSVAAGAFPEVASRDVQVKNVAATSHTYTYPLTRLVGQLMIVAVASAALTTIATPALWTSEGTQAGTESRLTIFSRLIDGTEDTTETLTFGTASGAVIRTWLMDVADNAVEVVAGINDSAAGTSLDLGAISPSWSVAEATNTTYIAVLALADDVAVSVFPAGYTVTGQDVSASATANIDCALAYAERSALGSTEDPGAFTYAASRSTGFIIAISPKVAGRMNWDGLTVRKAGVLVGTQRAVNLIEGTNISLTMADNPGTGAVDITVAATGGAGTPTWDQVLTAGHVSGANNAHIDIGQILSFGIEASLPPTGQIRSSTDLTIRADGSFETISSATMQFQTLGNIPIKFVTNTIERMEIRGDGAIEFNGITGTNGQFLTSTGGTTPPVWVTFAFSMMPSMNPDTFLGRLAGTGTPNPQVFTDIDSTSIIWDGTSHTFQRAAFTGDVTAAQDVNALTIGTNVVTNAKAAQMAANTIKANATAALANAADLAISADSFPARVGGNLVSHPFATLFGTYLSYSAGVADWIGLDVRVNSGALVGTRHRLNVIGTSPITVGAADDAGNDEVDVTISISSIPLSSLATVGALTVIANATNATAVPTAVASAADDTVFRRTASTLNWGQLTVGMAPNDVWTYAKIQNVSATARILGRITAAAGDIEELTGTQATTLLDVFTSGLKGLVPASGGGTTAFLRADGTFAQAAHTIRVNGGGLTQRFGLNFANTTSINASGADDAGNNESDITFNVNLGAAYAWTGTHDFQAQVDVGHIFRLTGTFSTTLAATTSNLAIGNANSVIITLTGTQSLTGMVPAFDGQMVWLENTDSVDILRLEHDVTSTAANRFYLPLSEQYSILARSGAWFRYNGTLQRWILADSKQFTGLSVREGVSVTSGVRTIGILDTTSIALSKTTPGASDDLDLSANLIVAHMAQQASSPTVGANNGMFWVDDLVPTRGMFTDDVEADWPLNVHGMTSNTAIQAVTNATTTITAATVTVPGNTLRVGTLYKLEGHGTFTRGATATATNLTVEISFGGTVYATATAALFTGAGTGSFTVQAYFTCLSIGAAGTFIANYNVINECAQITTPTAGQVYDAVFGSQNTAASGTTKDTTANQTLLLRANMTVAVANCTLQWTNGFIMKVT